MIRPIFVEYEEKWAPLHHERLFLVIDYSAMIFCLMTIIGIGIFLIIDRNNNIETISRNIKTDGQNVKIKFTCLWSKKCFIRSNYPSECDKKTKINNMTLYQNETGIVWICGTEKSNEREYGLFLMTGQSSDSINPSDYSKPASIVFPDDTSQTEFYTPFPDVGNTGIISISRINEKDIDGKEKIYTDLDVSPVYPSHWGINPCDEAGGYEFNVFPGQCGWHKFVLRRTFQTFQEENTKTIAELIANLLALAMLPRVVGFLVIKIKKCIRYYDDHDEEMEFFEHRAQEIEKYLIKDESNPISTNIKKVEFDGDLATVSPDNIDDLNFVEIEPRLNIDDVDTIRPRLDERSNLENIETTF